MVKQYNMTSLIKNKILTPVKIKQKHIDSPGLWIAVAVTSVSLHLLVVFWLLRSSSGFGFGFSQSSQNAVPIEFIEIASQPKSIPKSIPKTTVVVTKPPKVKTKLQPKLKPAPQPKSKPPLIGTVTSESSPPPKPKTGNKPKSLSPPKLKTGNKPKSLSPSKLKTGNKPKSPSPPKPTPTPSSSPTSSPSPTPSPLETPFLPNRGDVRLNTNQSQQLPNDSPEKMPTEGKSVAKMLPLPKKEVDKLIQEGRLRFKPNDLPEVLAEYKGSTTKKIDIALLHNEFEHQPVNKILASLVIDKNGKFQQSEVLETEPPSFMSRKNIYEEVLNDILKNEKFAPGHNLDGSKPEQSNLFINITIQPEIPK